MTTAPPSASAPGGDAPDQAVSLQGHYAGAVSRFAAYVVDQLTLGLLYVVGVVAIIFAINLVATSDLDYELPPALTVITFATWWLCYFGYSWAIGGRTFGMGLLGIRVVDRSGHTLSPWRAFLRAAALPLSFLLLGLGFLGILLGRERRALHDVIAHSAVVYEWDARAAQLRFLARATPPPG